MLEVADEGNGIPAKLSDERHADWVGLLGVGVRGMAERMAQLGGRLEITSTESGSTVRAEVPMSARRRISDQRRSEE